MLKKFEKISKKKVRLYIKMKNFYKKIFTEINDNLNKTDYNSIEKITKLILLTNKKNKKVIIFGNGGSAAIASHVSVDLTKNARIRCINFNEADLLTCFSNDYGYEKVFSKSLEFYADKGDLVIIVSASGRVKIY